MWFERMFHYDQVIWIWFLNFLTRWERAIWSIASHCHQFTFSSIAAWAAKRTSSASTTERAFVAFSCTIRETIPCIALADPKSCPEILLFMFPKVPILITQLSTKFIDAVVIVPKVVTTNSWPSSVPINLWSRSIQFHITIGAALYLIHIES